MARGFDSKFIEAQQEEASRGKSLRPALTPEQQVRAARRQALTLSRARAAADLDRATVPAHRQMLEQAIRALDAEIQQLEPGE
jgi:hypothetical protein